MIRAIVNALPAGAGSGQTAPSITVSVVSHGHCELVHRLLTELCRQARLVDHVILTHNVPAEPIPPPAGGWPFRLTEIFNQSVAGFGANHNRAFERCTTDYFCILNPDIYLSDDRILAQLLQRASEPGVGCAYPVLLNPDGSVQDNEREAVSPLALWRRHVLKRPQGRVDWISGAFWLVSAAAWRQIGGFDERYFMYCEDADFCMRLQLAGWRIARADASAIHDASWSSRRPGRPMVWHIQSMLRLWLQPAMRHYLRARARARVLRPVRGVEPPLEVSSCDEAYYRRPLG